MLETQPSCRTLLLHDFGVRWELPLERLCPTVPSRLNYLLWIQDLLDLRPAASASEPIRGVDIGTGASCIYPLLGVARFGWRFIATEVDATSTHWARQNVALNQWLAGKDSATAALSLDAQNVKSLLVGCPPIPNLGRQPPYSFNVVCVYI